MKHLAATLLPAMILVACGHGDVESELAIADKVTGESLAELITGKTAYISIPPGGPGGPDGGIAPFYFGSDGTSAAKLPAGMTLVGTWQALEDRYCADWDNGPKNSCSAIVQSGDTYKIVDAATGDARGEIVEFKDGNPEGY